MDRLWAPWRSKYIYSKSRKRCIFCGNKKNSRDGKRYILRRTKYSFSMLNIYPYNNGHIMVAPFRHVKNLKQLTQDELSDLMGLVKKEISILDRSLKPHGYNIGMNIGKVSGVGYAGHIHIHIVPRWQGDTNFMPLVASTKIMAESLSALYARLKPKG